MRRDSILPKFVSFVDILYNDLIMLCVQLNKLRILALSLYLRSEMLENLTVAYIEKVNNIFSTVNMIIIIERDLKFCTK